MRLWHKDLIPVLPRKQLLGQWRELCAIMRNIDEKGTPNHVLVNKVMDYPPEHIFSYAFMVSIDMVYRGYSPEFTKFSDRFSQWIESDTCDTVRPESLFQGWHNDRYLTQCYYNLQEKHDCGGITDEEWERIERRYSELMEG